MTVAYNTCGIESSSRSSLSGYESGGMPWRSLGRASTKHNSLQDGRLHREEMTLAPPIRVVQLGVMHLPFLSPIFFPPWNGSTTATTTTNSLQQIRTYSVCAVASTCLVFSGGRHWDGTDKHNSVSPSSVSEVDIIICFASEDGNRGS